MDRSLTHLIGILLFFIGIFIFFYEFNKRLLDWLRFQSLDNRDYIVQKLSIMYIDIPANRILIGIFSISFGLGSIVFLIFLPNIFPGIIFGIFTAIVGWKMPRPFVDWLYQRRVNQVVLQMVDGLSLMSNGLKSGLSLVQSVGLVTQEMPYPIQQEFQLILNENKLGLSLEDAFENLSKRIISDDVQMFVTSVNILKETGGNLSETFDTIVTTIRERMKIEKKISAMTAQGFYQGMIIAAIPPILFFIFCQTDPELMRPLYTTTLGWLIIFIILILEFLGCFLIMKIIKIDV